MSQENNLNIDGILEQIKSLPENIKSNWNGISSDRICLYRDIILSLENNDINKMSSSLLSAFKSLAIIVDTYKPSNIVKLDVDIVMKLTEKLLERAKDIVVDDGVVDTNFIDGMEWLFRSLGDITNIYRQQKEAKITGQDIEKCISLADKVFASSNHIKTNVLVLNNIFSILNNTIYYCNKEVKSESVSKVIEFVETVEKDKRIQWDAVTIRSVLWALRSISKRSESLSPDQADKIFNMTNAFVNKIDNLGTLNSTHVCAMLINPLKDMLCKKNNPAKIDVKQCLDLVEQILNKSDIVPHPNMSLDLMETIIDIVKYYGKHEENLKEISEYGFNIENGEIKSFDSNKLKKFVSDKMFGAFENYLRDKLGAIGVTENRNENENDNKNSDDINKRRNSTVNVNVPSENQNLSEVSPNTKINNNQSTQTDVQNNKTTFNQPEKEKAKNELIKIQSNPQINENNETKEVQKGENTPIDNLYQLDINASSVQTNIQNNANNFKNPEKETVKDDNKNITQNNPRTSENNEAKGDPKNKDEKDEYKPTKTFAILTVLSLFVPFIPGLIFVIVSNNQKESHLIKFLSFVPIISPIIWGIKTYRAYWANEALATKKALAETDPGILKINDSENIQEQKSPINNDKEQNKRGGNNLDNIPNTKINDVKRD